MKPQRPIKGISCVILAGGESKRIGEDKANVRLSGKTLLDRVFNALKPLFSDIMISVHTKKHPIKRTSDKSKSFRFISDDSKKRGPILGLIRALENSHNQWVFAIACDMPFVNDKLIRNISRLRKNYDCVVPVVNGRLEPLFGLYKKTCLKPILAKIKKGDFSLVGFIKEVRRLKIRYVREEELKKIDPDFRSFIDIDSLKDLKCAQAILKRKKNEDR